MLTKVIMPQDTHKSKAYTVNFGLYVDYISIKLAGEKKLQINTCMDIGVKILMISKYRI